ncbi:carbohydrate sulfotransferase 15-like isoform X2 [Apostichopus japonicus]|uniref:carbohydrate sulfotransferase 15-like isoform X2 n=1 Tax=Stichopus japonicus TaxID=307972 RepID=UPI003AB2D8AE
MKARTHRVRYLILVLLVILLTCCTFMWKEGRTALSFQETISPTSPLIQAHVYAFRKIEGATNQPNHRERMSIDKWKPYLHEVLNRFPANFSSEFRNPCWYEGTELQCVPYFYQLGSFKCGTTDVWDKLVQHPDVLPVAKEPHWWAWRRFGYMLTPIHEELVRKTRRKTGQGNDHSIQWYLNLFRIQAVEQVKKNPRLVFGDASISNLWGLGIYDWEELFTNETDPPVFLADVIHAIQPKAKIIAILRDPVEKLWTTYMLEQWKKMVSPQTFHAHFKRLTKESLQCESINSPLYCAFMYGTTADISLNNMLYQGVFYLYLQQWVDVFGLENIHVMRLEDWIKDPITELEEAFKYLELDPLPHDVLSSIVNRSTKNVNERAKRKNFTMLASTRRELQDFYRPWNQRLADLLKNQKFTWDY